MLLTRVKVLMGNVTQITQCVGTGAVAFALAVCVSSCHSTSTAQTLLGSCALNWGGDALTPDTPAGYVQAKRQGNDSPGYTATYMNNTSSNMTLTGVTITQSFPGSVTEPVVYFTLSGGSKLVNSGSRYTMTGVFAPGTAGQEHMFTVAPSVFEQGSCTAVFTQGT